jgi:hypothetical protein
VFFQIAHLTLSLVLNWPLLIERKRQVEAWRKVRDAKLLTDAQAIVWQREFPNVTEREFAELLAALRQDPDCR